MLYLIGLGLGDEKDVTLKGLEAIKSADRVFLEAYTSILGVDQQLLEQFYGKKIEIADRDLVESESDQILKNAKNGIVCFLVVGDPLAATTHTDLMLRAKQQQIKIEVIHNASIMNAVASCGLQLYQFGPAVSIPFFNEKWRPQSFYDKILFNKSHGFHTLCLLDIKVKEQSEENLLRGRKIYEPPRFMTIGQCISQLLEVESIRGEKLVNDETICIGLARVGKKDQRILSGTLKQLSHFDFGGPLHSFVIPGKTHELEDEFLASISVTKFIEENQPKQQ